MKKLLIIVFVLFASSLVFLISCDKESITPLISEENQGEIYKEQGGANDVSVCCLPYKTLHYTAGEKTACCDPGFTCAPCTSIPCSMVSQTLNILQNMLSHSNPSVQDFFSDLNNYEILFPSLLTLDCQDLLNKLKSGDYILIEIIIDSKTNNRVYVFEHKNTGVRICLVVNLI